MSLFAWAGGQPDRRAVTQCALSRVCGACGATLGRPIAFVGTPDEVSRNAFHAPPLHAACADRVRQVVGDDAAVVLTSGYEFVRPSAEDTDPLPRFTPNSLL